MKLLKVSFTHIVDLFRCRSRGFVWRERHFFYASDDSHRGAAANARFAWEK